MDYSGNLYGKVGSKYFPLEMTAEEVNDLEKENEQLKAELAKLKAEKENTVLPDCSEIRDQIQGEEWAEGTANVKPRKSDILAWVKSKKWAVLGDIDISFDAMQQVWRWYCDIKKPTQITVNELIDKLLALPDSVGNLPVCILDQETNLHYDMGDGEGSGLGVYSSFSVNIMGENEIPDGSKPWVAIAIDNSDVDLLLDEIQDLRDSLGC